MVDYGYKNYTEKSFAKLMDETGEVGYVQAFEHPVIQVSGLPGATTKEVVLFEDGGLGYVILLNEDSVKIVSLSRTRPRINERVVRTDCQIELPASMEVLGKSLDSLGNTLHPEINSVEAQEWRPIDIDPPEIDKRVKINRFFETGVSVVDMLIPLGKGQRELVLGNRKTGKTDFLLQTMLTQAKQGAICIYACIGKTAFDIKKVESFIAEKGIQDGCVIMSSYATDPTPLIYLTPFSAMTLAEFFLNSGKDVLLILDDLTDHAKYYREMSLMAGKFPGRSAYPADMFYTHSRLLERAGYFKTNKGVNSITCLPVAETVQGDITGYIQTNLMSITDGHIYFDEDLFLQGIRPAINYSLSVTRVGRQTQTRLRWSVARELTSFLGQLEKTQTFIHFGAEINQGIKSTLAMGEKLIQGFFNQESGHIVESNAQILLFALIWSQTLQNKSIDELRQQCKIIAERYRVNPEYKKTVDSMINSCEDLNKLLGLISAKHMILI